MLAAAFAAWALLRAVPVGTGLFASALDMAGDRPRRWLRHRPAAARRRSPSAGEPGTGGAPVEGAPDWDAWAELMPASLLVLDAHSHRVLAINRSARREFLLRRNRLVGRAALEAFVRVVDAPALLQRLATAADGEAVVASWRRGARACHVELRQRLLPAVLGSPRVRVLVARDITLAQEQAQRLQEATEHLRLVGDSPHDCLFVSDPQRSRVEFLGPGVERIWGVGADVFRRDAAGALAQVLPEDRPLFIDRCQREQALEPVDLVYRIQHPQRGVRTLRSRTRTVVDADGRLRVHGVLSDVTEQHRHELELCRARDEAQAASQAKSQFMANMSHEIRTPMNGILGMTELLLGTDLSNRQRRFAQAVYRSGESLLEIINDILDFSKIEAGKLELAPTDFLLRGVVEDTLELLAPRAHEKGLELSFREAAGLPALVHGDPLRLRQVLTNLVANAIKFTHVGEVVVDLRRLDAPADTADGLLLEFAVRDTGIGIEPDVLPRLFSAFTQAHGGMSRRYGGTGLGLAISRQLVELMGGEIRAESAPGRGSAFLFTVAARVARPLATSAGPQSDFNSLHGPLDLPTLQVLVVDDHPTNRSVLENMLGAWGMEVTLAHDGRQALDLLHPAGEGVAPPHFDLALIDMHMPRLDGLGLAHAVRAAGLHPDMKMILLSSVSSPDDVLASQRAGFQRFVAKPVRRAELRQALLNLSEPGELPPLGSAEVRLEGHVLVIEDNVVNQEVIGQMLRQFGLRVTVASAALHGLRKLGEAHFDLVLMDIQMPGMDGVEALSWFRRGSGSRFTFVTPHDTPVIAVTANALDGDEERFRTLGFDDYLSKPFRQSQLLAMLTQRLRPQAPAGDADAGSGPASVPPAASAASAAPAGQSGVLDAGALARLRELDPQGKNRLLERVSQAFNTSTTRLLPMLHDALRANNLAGVRHVAHTLKSSSASIGALCLSQQCAELEAQIRLERVENLATQVQGITDEIEVVLQALKKLMDQPA